MQKFYTLTDKETGAPIAVATSLEEAGNNVSWVKAIRSGRFETKGPYTMKDLPEEPTWRDPKDLQAGLVVVYGKLDSGITRRMVIWRSSEQDSWVDFNTGKLVSFSWDKVRGWAHLSMPVIPKKAEKEKPLVEELQETIVKLTAEIEKLRKRQAPFDLCCLVLD